MVKTKLQVAESAEREDREFKELAITASTGMLSAESALMYGDVML